MLRASPNYSYRTGFYANGTNSFKLYFTYSTDGTSTTTLQSNELWGSYSTGTWYHVAHVRSGSNLYQYINGTRVGSHSISGTLYNSADSWFLIGHSASQSSHQRVDEVRISKGTDRGYTGASITPPSSKFTNDSYTYLLLHFEPNTFNLPDLRGLFMRGVDRGRGRDNFAADRCCINCCGNTGDCVGSCQGHCMRCHRHCFRAYCPGHWDDSTANSAYQGMNSFQCCQYSCAVTNSAITELRDRNVAMNFIIKY